MPHRMTARGGRRSRDTLISQVKKIYGDLLKTTCVKYGYCRPGDNKFITELNEVFHELSRVCIGNISQFSLWYARYSKRDINKGEEHLVLFTRDPRRVSGMLGIDHYVKLAYDHVNERFYIKTVWGNQMSLFDSFMPLRRP